MSARCRICGHENAVDPEWELKLRVAAQEFWKVQYARAWATLVAMFSIGMATVLIYEALR